MGQKWLGARSIRRREGSGIGLERSLSASGASKKLCTREKSWKWNACCYVDVREALWCAYFKWLSSVARGKSRLLSFRRLPAIWLLLCVMLFSWKFKPPLELSSNIKRISLLSAKTLAINFAPMVIVDTREILSIVTTGSKSFFSNRGERKYFR